MKHAGGRPTIYKPEYVGKVDEYLKICKDEDYDWTKTEGKLLTTYEHRIKVKLPTREGFSIFLDVSLRVLTDWSEKYPEFLHALRKIDTAQKERLIAMGLSGEYNPTIAKLILSANHGMRDRTDITSDDKALPTPILGTDKKD